MADLEIPDEPSIIAQRLEDYIYEFYGEAGVGKTTFVRELFGADRTLFLSSDRGTRDQKTRRVEVHRWKDVRVVFKKLEKNIKGVEVLVFDHVDDMLGMIENYVCEFYTEKAAHGSVYDSIDEVPHGKGWALLKREIASMVQRTLRLGVTPVFIAHEDVRTVVVNGREFLKAGPSFSKQGQKFINPVANIIGQISIQRIKQADGKKRPVRVLTTQPSDTLFAKDRTCRQKSEKGWEILDAEAFRATFEKPVVKGRRAKH